MMGFTPLTIRFWIGRRGCANPWTVPGTNVYRSDKWFRVVKKGEKVKGPVVVSSTPAAVPCKSTMAESVLYTDRAARAEAEGLRHGKHSLLPKRVAASHSLQQQQMRHAHTKLTGHTHFFFLFFFLFFFFLLKNIHTMYTLPNTSSWESRKWMTSQRRQSAATWDDFSRWIQRVILIKKNLKLLLNYKMTDPTVTSQKWYLLCTFA